MGRVVNAADKFMDEQSLYERSEERIRLNKIRRERIFKRQLITLFGVVAVVIFAIVFCASSFLSDAESDTFKPEYKYYTSVTVDAGSSLQETASEYYSSTHYANYDAYITEICNINSIHDSSKVYAGDILIVPYYSTEYK